MRNVSATKQRPFPSKQKATGLASNGSAANNSIVNPRGTRAWAMACRASLEAGAILGSNRSTLVFAGGSSDNAGGMEQEKPAANMMKKTKLHRWLRNGIRRIMNSPLENQ